MILQFLLLALLVACCFSLRTDCQYNSFSVNSFDIVVNFEKVSNSSGILTIHPFLWFDEEGYDSVSSLSLCVIVLTINQSFCRLPIDNLQFSIPTKDQIDIEASVCDLQGNDCFCITITQAVISTSDELLDNDEINSFFTVLSPHDNQTIVTDFLLLFIQTSPRFLLGSDGILCLNSSYRKDVMDVNLVDTICYDQYPDFFPSANRSVLSLLELETGYWDFTAIAYSKDKSQIFQQTSVSFYLLSSDDCAQYSANSRSNVNEIMLYDSTYYFENEEDILLMRLLEHVEVDVFVPIEANQAHNGTARKLVFPLNKSARAFPESTSYDSLVDYSELVDFILETVQLADESKKLLRVILESDKKAIARTQVIDDMTTNLALDNYAKDSQQRDSIVSVLENIKEYLLGPPVGHYTIISDTDEIFHQSSIRKLKECKVLSDYRQSNISLHSSIFSLMDYYLYNFNNNLGIWGIENMEAAYVISNEILTECDPLSLSPTKIRRIFRREYRSSLIDLARCGNIVIWKDMGWHLSAFKSAEDLATIKRNSPALSDFKEFFTTEHMNTLQMLGLGHEQLSKSVNQLLGELTGRNQKSKEVNLPQVLQNIFELQSKYVPSKANFTEKMMRNMILQLQQEYKVKMTSNLVFQAAADVIAFEISCSPTRVADRVAVLDICKQIRGSLLCDDFLEYADLKCSMSSNEKVKLEIL